MRKMPSGFRTSHAFSILELLTVIAIAAIVVGLVVSGTGTSQSSILTTSANQLIDSIALAREVSIAKNQPVEIWFMRPKGEPFVTTVQTRLIDASGNSSPWGSIIKLGTGFGIDTGATLSPFVNSANTKQFGSTPAPRIGALGTEYDCWYIRFQPDGTPTLSQAAQQFFTIHKITDGNGLSQLPPNYAVISISPATGKATQYRP